MLANLKRKRNDEGFTLIELLIVIIILAILAVIVIFAVGTTTKNASVAACKSTVKTVETALETYKAELGSFPTSIATLTSTKATPTTPTTTNRDVGPWLRSLPTTNTNGHYSISLGASGTVLVNYKTGASPTSGTADTTPSPCTKV